MKGYGRLIEQARISAGLTPEELGRKLGRTKGIVYRLEAEEQEPNAEQVNRLAAALPISVEQILSAMGIHMTPFDAAKLPRPLIEALLRLRPEELAVVTRVATGLHATQPRQGGQPQ